MKTVAVICEYNPFHLGHAYQIQSIKEAFGEDTAVIALMSGNYVQRGELAVLGKFRRAQMAVDAGASLVLELPFPFSLASAEFFAEAGVSMADALGAVDLLSFGSECGDLALLSDTAEKLTDSAFVKDLSARLRSKEEKDKGYPKLLTELFAEHYGKDFPVSLSLPNNILAISYISALKKLHSPIMPHTVKRMGSDEDGATDADFAGATYIRSLLHAGKTEEALSHLPEATHPLWHEVLRAGLAPTSPSAISAILLSHLRMADPPKEMPAECGGGVLSLLKKAAKEATDLDTLIKTAATKKYTAARLRRATLFSYFGVTPAMLKAKPLYTQVLAMDAKGQAVLAHIRKKATISLLTKPADLHKLSPAARAQAELSYRADSVYALALPTPQKADIFLRTAPYRK